MTAAGRGTPFASRTIGVVIRTLDESEWIGRCLEMLHHQRGGFDPDVVVVDSGSTDSTLDIARAHGARTVEMSPADFDYSKSLNLGIGHVRGDIVVSLSAHAIPVDREWLQKMAAPFEDPQVAGVTSREVPWPDAPWHEVHRLRRQFGESPGVYSHENADEILFSNAASAVRRSVWAEHPFALPIAEDLEWARRVVAAGWTIVYEAGAVVHHSHCESARERARRSIDFNRIAAGGGSRRGRRRAVREAAGLVFRGSRTIRGLDERVPRKLIYLGDLLRVACYYVLDFSRSGTTAERRRRNASPPAGMPPPRSDSEP